MAVIWGRHPINEALSAGRTIDRIYVADGARATGPIVEILSAATTRGIQASFVDRKVLDRLTDGANHQGVVAEVAEYSYRELDDIFEAGDSTGQLPLILALDSLEDPQNFGTLLRSCDAVGATGVLIPLHRAVGVTPAVEKASAGAVEHQLVARVTNMVRALRECKEHRFWIAGLDERGTTNYDQFPVDSPLVLVVGAEGGGMSRLVREACDYLVRLPMRGHVASLNASVAGSIVLYEIARRRSTLAPT